MLVNCEKSLLFCGKERMKLSSLPLRSKKHWLKSGNLWESLHVPDYISENNIHLSSPEYRYSTTSCKWVICLSIHHPQFPPSIETTLLPPPVDAGIIACNPRGMHGARKQRWMRPSENPTSITLTKKRKEGKDSTWCFSALIILYWKVPDKTLQIWIVILPMGWTWELQTFRDRSQKKNKKER